MSIAPFGDPKYLCEYRAIRTSRYTYVRDLNGPWLMFDDQNDPFQMDNLAGKPEKHKLQEKLDAQLQAQLKKVGDDFRPAQSYIEEWGYHVGPFESIPYGPNDERQSPMRKAQAK
jgi:hypothetical protein